MLKDIDFGVKYDINNYQDVSQQIFPKLRTYCDKYNVTFLVTHHLNKTGKTLGSVALDVTVDGRITLIENKANKKYVKLQTINRDFSEIDIQLKKLDNLIFRKINSIEEDELSFELTSFIKYLASQKEIDFTCTDIVLKANIPMSPKRFGRLLNNNIELLESEGVHITRCRTADRIGTGNYYTNRTKYNIQFIPLCSTNLASLTYKTLYKNNVEFNKNNKNINLLNGCIITRGQEFFKSLGMKFEDTGRKYLTGEHKGEPINKVAINNPNDIPEQVLNYFKYSHEFLSNLVGKENIVYSAINFDEDTQHMHFYFTPVVNEVHRKVFETDSNGHQILKSYIGKDGKEKLIPIQKKEESSKNLYSIEKGKFLNCDQFWKDKGFKTSFAKTQDDYNKFITSKGFNLDRGQIGGNKYHQTKAEKYFEELHEKTN